MVSATRCTFQTTNLWSHCSNLVQVVCLSALSRRLSHYGVRHSRSSSENTSTHTVKSADVPRWNHEHAETARSQGDECWQSYSRFVRWQRRKLRIETVKNTFSQALTFFFSLVEGFFSTDNEALCDWLLLEFARAVKNQSESTWISSQLRHQSEIL